MPETSPVRNVLAPQDLALDPGQEAKLRAYVHRELSLALENHTKRQELLAEYLHAYKALPEFETKNFPWPNASNVVVPVVPITVDTVASRLQRAFFGAKDPVEAHLNTATPFMMTVPPDPMGMPGAQVGDLQKPLEDKDIRDWARWFLTQSGAQDRLRTVFIDMPLYGDAFCAPQWVEEKRIYHAYGEAGEVVSQEVPGYTGVRWNIASCTDVFWPTGYDEWQQLPWFALRLRYSKAELHKFVSQGAFRQEDVVRLKPRMREDKIRQVQKKAEHINDGSNEIYELYEIRGMFEIAAADPLAAPTYEEVVLTYSLDSSIMLRGIYNPYFGKSRHFVKIPYLVQPHEIVSTGAAEQALPFQKEATTAHNQVIDAGTAANAGITILSTNVDLKPNEEIHPGKTLFTDGDPQRDINVVHLGEASQTLGQVEEKAFFMNEKRTGVSTYNMGMESAVIGSRATATGTTALINEGNQRFWVSIDDMRKAIEELLYLTIQLEQQMRPEGYYYMKGRYIQFPPGDPRTTLALRLAVSSETINRDLEVQQMQLLMAVTNDYYMRLNQAMMLVANPQFPPQAKMMAVSTMEASSKLVRKFVERFDIEDLDAIVPSVLATLQQMSAMMMQAQQMGAIPPGSGPGAAMPPNGANGAQGPMAGAAQQPPPTTVQ